MASHEKSEQTMPIPALLVERAIALARAEAGLALVHTRRIAVRAVSALLGTIMSCAFAMLTLSLLVVWPVLVSRVPLVNLLFGVLASVLLACAGAAFAVVSWAGVARERRTGPMARAAVNAQPAEALPALATARSASEPPRAVYDTPKPARAVGLAERVSL